jgi:hypothetical protein
VSDLFSEPLAAHHDRVAFRCGVPELDSYLQTQANQDIRRKVAAVYVLVDRAAPTVIVGYYTLSSFAVETSDLTEDVQKKLPRYPLTPATLVGRLARDSIPVAPRLSSISPTVGTVVFKSMVWMEPIDEVSERISCTAQMSVPVWETN